MKTSNAYAIARAAIAISVLLLSACGGGGSEASDISSTNLAAQSDLMEPVSAPAAVRFLEQASFGPTTKTIARVQELGFSAYIDEQFSLPISRYAAPLSSDPGMKVLQQRFFQNALNGTDQLRQRMAFALSQIFVVSSQGIFVKDAIFSYQTMLLERALGNYYDLLRAVTLHPAMGAYLDMANNAKGDSPNENYAREVMQLFSIGPTKLNQDGSDQRDSQGVPIAAYTQNEVEGLARTLTGWTYPTRPGATTRPQNPRHFYGPMIASESLHDDGAKILLKGVRLPAGQSVEQDLADALHAIFMHPNVGPFIGFRLIQHFVTSNPSPMYVRRIARVFNDNGQGVRGDLRAVVKAILLDPEARRGDDPRQAELTDGKLKEPVLFITGLLRALGAQSTGYGINGYSWSMGQNMFSAPSVFSYYPPDHVLPESGLYGPEFKLRTSPSIVAVANFVNSVVYGHVPDVMSINLAKWTALAADTTNLINAIDLRLMHGSMSRSMRAIIAAAVDSQPPEFTTVRAQTALYLAATSPQYAVQH